MPGIVVADVSDETVGGGFDGVQFVVLAVVVAGSRGDGAGPLPADSVVDRECGPDAAGALVEFLAGVQQAAIGECDGPVRAVDSAAGGS